MKTQNICRRCGQERILIKTWQEKVDTMSGTSVLTYSEYSCPNPECQKLVDSENETRREVAKERERMNQEREQARTESRQKSLRKNSPKKSL